MYSVPLNPHIRVILIKGLLNGVSYLYKNGYGSHGNLHCRSLYIDRSWNLKVAGFGLSNYVRETGPPFNIEVGNKDGGYDPPTEIYFVAPELLPVYPRVMKGTIKGDMFSIGMLMYTIINQSIPFEEVSDIKFILQSLLQDPMHSFELRPTFHRSTPEHYSNLVHLCWQSDPESRPALADVMHTMNNLDSPEFWALMREEGGDMAKVATRT